MDNELISIIVPIYNVEKYLKKCLDSILAQTYTNLEIILIDDGSPDGCPAICDEYAEKDDRIVVIHKENGGVSSARNAGLENVSGEFIGWVDPDDYIEPNMFEELYKNIKENNSDISICGVKKIGLVHKDKFYGTKILNSKEFMKALLSEDVESYTWNKLYKRNLFDNIEFPVGELFEDMKTLHLIGEKANKISFTDSTFYNYRIRENSITSINKGKKASDFLEATQIRCDRYKDTEFFSYAVTGKFKCLRVIVSDLSYMGNDDKLKRQLFLESKKLYKICKFNLNKFQKLITLLYFLSPKLYAIFKKIYLKS